MAVRKSNITHDASWQRLAADGPPVVATVGRRGSRRLYLAFWPGRDGGATARLADRPPDHRFEVAAARALEGIEFVMRLIAITAAAKLR
jgi:hypothetical protein